MEEWRPPILESERLYLRPIEPQDAESIFAYASNETVAMYTSWYAHASMEETNDFIFINSMIVRILISFRFK